MVIRAKDGGKTLYHMGDTDIFSDMALLNSLYAPDIGIVPIGDRFTMNPQTAALACTRYFSFLQRSSPAHLQDFSHTHRQRGRICRGQMGDDGRQSGGDGSRRHDHRLGSGCGGLEAVLSSGPIPRRCGAISCPSISQPCAGLLGLPASR